MKKAILTLFVAAATLISCSSDDSSSSSQDPIIGTWRLTSWSVDGVNQGLGCDGESDLTFSSNGNFSIEEHDSDLNGDCLLVETITGTWSRVSDGVYSTTMDGETGQGPIAFSNNNNTFSTTEVDEGETYVNTYTRQ